MPAMTAAWRNPLHTTITSITYDVSTRTATAMIRVFVDDLARAVTARTAHASDSAAAAYVREMFAIIGDDGRPVALGSCGFRRTGDVQWTCLRASLPHGLSGVWIQDAVLTDLYADQLNVVMA